MAWNGQSAGRNSQFRGHGGMYTTPPKENTFPGGGDSITRITDLSTGFSDVKIVGIIIGKEEPRSFPNKKDPNQDRNVVSLTIRDSEKDFINVTFWGSQEYTHDISSSFRFGDIVEIANVGVQNKPDDGSADKYHPRTPGQYALVASENRTQMNKYTGWNEEAFGKLAFIPVKAANDYFTIADIMANGKNLHGKLISILTIIKTVGEVRNFTGRNGRQLKRREVKLFDNTAPSFTLVLWDEGLINLAESWVPKENVIFAADVKITFDEYKKTMIATASSNTIITTDPETDQAIDLGHYAQGAEIPCEAEAVGTVADNRMPLESIKNVYSIEQVKMLMTSSLKEYGITYAFVTDFNIDYSDSHCIVTRCGKCRRKINADTGACINADCPQGSGNVDQELDTNLQYKISLSLSDHTATIYSGQLTDDTAQLMINCNVSDYLFMSDDQRTQMKWEYLLERCKVHFRVDPPFGQWRKPTLRVLSCVVADPEETMSFMQ